MLCRRVLGTGSGRDCRLAHPLSAPSLGFLVGNFNAGMVILKPLVATVGIEAGRRQQRWSALTDLKIMNPSGRRFGDADDAAILLRRDLNRAEV